MSHCSKIGVHRSGSSIRPQFRDHFPSLWTAEDKSLNQDIVKGALEGVELGPLKGNQGDQNYDVQSSVDLRKYNAVVIYCERFHAVFGVARLEQF